MDGVNSDGSSPVRREDWSTPALFPVQFDASNGTARIVRLDEADYRSASFLDERILTPRRTSWERPWGQVEAAVAGLRTDCDFIFHIGHVGSTLVSRLLGEARRLFSVREPAALRTLVELAGKPDFDAKMEVCLRAMARVWRPGERSLVKATSFVAEIAPELMTAARTARALLMFETPQIYIAGILAGENSRADARLAALGRLARLERRLGADLTAIRPRGDGEAAAVAWACGIMALTSVAAALPRRILWVEFTPFLLEPRAGLARMISFLQGRAEPGDLEAMMSSGHLGRYSKSPEFRFDSGVRDQLLAETRHREARELEAGFLLLNRLGGTYPVFASAVRQLAAAREPNRP